MESLDPNMPHPVALPTSNDHYNRSRELFDLVFGVDLLREKIINYVIHEGGRLSRTNVVRCRLVQHSWNESVSKCILATREPMFQFNLDTEDDMAPHSPVKQFLHDYASSSRVFERTPPFALTLTVGNKIPGGNSKNVLERCLHWCASGLVVLHVRFSSHDLKAPDLPKDLSLPVLHKLNMSFSDAFSTRLGDVLQIFGVPEILSACKKLQYFSLVGVKRIPVPIDSLRLPDTLTNLELGRGSTFEHLEQLVKSNATAFPKLTSLTLNIPDASYDGKDTVYQILDQVRLTLKTFCLEGGGAGANEEWEDTPIHFPVMKCLESCLVNVISWKWAENAVVNMERDLPVIKHLKLGQLTAAAFRKLVENSQFESVEELQVFLISVEMVSNTDLPLALAKLPQTFPNITALDISLFNQNEAANTVHPIFQSMSQLERLSIYLFHMCTFPNTNEFWNNMFLGMSPEGITATTIPYIAQLSELRVLQLNLEGGYQAVLPDAVFESGFLKMPKLLDLKLMGHFKASPIMEERWRQAGRGEIYGGDGECRDEGEQNR